MAGKTDTSATLFAQKKLLGKAHTSNLKIDGEEVIGSNIQTSTDLIFGDPVPNSPSLSLYSVQSASLGSNPSVEYIQFVLNVLTGTTYDANDPGAGGGTDTGEGSQTSGPHTYKFRLPSNYESLTDNPNAGNGVFNNDRLVHETLGRLQLVPPFFSQTAPNPYIVKIYKDNGSGGVGEEIPLLDNIDWNVDFYNGILFIQDYNPTKIPAFARAFAYVGRMAEDVIVKTESPLQQGAVLFGGSTGKISQNIDKIFWDNLHERLGIGTSQPGSTLTVSGSSRTIGELSVTGSIVVTGSAVPGANSTYSLGLINNRWKTLFAESGSFSGPVTIEGDLTVLGTQTVISSTIVDIGDNIIVLNSVSTPQRFGGLYVIDQDTNQTGSLIWDSLNDRWLSGIKDSEVSLVSGSGINNRVARWSGTNGVSYGIIYDDGVNVGIGTDAGVDRLTVDGEVSVTGSIHPGITKTYNLGSLDKAWKNVYSSTGSFGDLYADGSLFVSGNSYLTGSVFANSDFSVSGSSYLTGSVFAQSNIFVSGSSYLTGSIFANSDVFVSGSITVTGSTLVHGVFTAENDVYITGTLYGDDHLQVGDDIVPEFDKTFSIGSATNLWKNVYSSTGSFGDLYADGNLSVSGSSYLTGSLTLLSDAFISGSTSVSGSLYISGSAYVTGSLLVSSEASISGSAYVSGSLWVSGSSFLTGSVYALSDAFVSGSLNVSGSAYVTGSVEVLSDLLVSGNLQVTGSALVHGILTAESDMYVTGTLYGNENLIVGDNVFPDVTETYNIGSSLNKWKNVYSSTGSFGDLFADGNLSVSGSSYLTGSLVALSDAFISGSTSISGSLNVSGSSFLTGSLEVLSNLWVSGNLSVTGSAIIREVFTAESDVYVTGTLYGNENLIVGDNIVPNLDKTHDIGTTTNTWNRVFAQAFSGSLTRLASGEDYLRAGSNITITTGSNGSVTIATVNNGTITSVSAGTGLSGGGSSGTVTLSINPSIVARVDGTTFTGATVHTAGLSGSLTKLSDGVTNYLQAGSNITISTGSNGAVTISSTAGGGGAVVAGSNTQVQFNDNGSLNASPNFVFDKTTGSVTASIFVASSGISGSLTTLSDGSPYLLAGSGITLTTGSLGEVTISSTGGGGGGGGGTIGPAEDGTYEDGLFTDFTSDTPIGTPIDRFNEVLLALAPPPAPRIRNVNSSNTDGTTAYLSFGTSNNQAGTGNPYFSVGTTAGFSAVDVNGQYVPASTPASPSTSGNNLRKGIYKKDAVLRGILNDNVTAYVHNTGVTNYASKTFGNGDVGTLRLIVNGSTVHVIDLTSPTIGAGNPGSGTGVHLNANDSGFIDLSIPGPGKLSTGIDFPAFKHRTGRYQIDPKDQRNGWNYARVVHIIGANQYVTNYVEWVNDSDSTPIGAPDGSLAFEGSGSLKLSGVEYFMSGSLRYSATVTNAYRYVYDLNPITFSTSFTSVGGAQGVSFGFSSEPKPTINTAAGENHNKQLTFSKYSELHADFLLNGTVSAGVNVSHPLKSSLVNGASFSIPQILFYKLGNTSTNLIETFRAENYRLTSGPYNTQNDVTDSANSWDSSVHMLSTTGYSDGLQFYNQLLLSPKNTLNGGNFSALTNAPSGNPDYSGVSGTKTFYRWFKNVTGSSVYDLVLLLNGSSTIVSEGTSFSSSNLKVSVKVPGKTGWLDVGSSYSYGSNLNTDGTGFHVANPYITFDNSLNATNYLTLGTLEISNNDYIVVKVSADSSWTGNLSLMQVTFGAGSGGLTPVPDLSEVDCDNSGISALLSFGSSKSITGYSNSSTTAGFSAVDLNGLYQIATSGTNLRRGIFSTLTNIEGDLNESVVASALSYVNNAFSDANRGILSLELNGSTIHSTNLGTFSSGNDLNANGSGFISLSAWSTGFYGNGVPSYFEFQRTGRYRVSPADQRNGWNYLKVTHNVDGVNRVTNYVEWINAPDTAALSSANNGLSIFGDNTFSYLSGVKYFNSPSGSISTSISNIYKNVYTNSASAISLTSLSNATAATIEQSGNGITSTKTTSGANASLQSLNTNLDSQNEVLNVVGTINFTLAKSLPGTWTTAYGCGGAMTFLHPYKSSLTTPSQSTTNLLVWTPSDTSNANTTEQFTGETYRITDSSYTSSTSQDVLTNGTRVWNSQLSMNDQAGYPEHATGLLVYDTYLMAPKNGGAGGNFRNHKEGGSIESPAGNVDYSSLTNVTRTYYRSFLNNTSADANRVRIYLYGDATWKAKNGPNAGSLGANKNVWVHVGVPGKTSLLDSGRPTEGDSNFAEDDGALVGTFSSSVTASGVNNLITFNGAAARGTASPTGSPERIVIRITASSDWTGYLDRIVVVWGG